MFYIENNTSARLLNFLQSCKIYFRQVIQRRDDIGDPIRENFNRDWTDYKNGFGDPTKEFWMGNENIYMLTSNDEYMLRIEMEDFEGNRR